jgi:hypothetical protein
MLLDALQFTDVVALAVRDRPRVLIDIFFQTNIKAMSCCKQE